MWGVSPDTRIDIRGPWPVLIRGQYAKQFSSQEQIDAAYISGEISDPEAQLLEQYLLVYGAVRTEFSR